MATPNYGYEKRQRELAKKKKKEEKTRAKAARKAQGGEDEAVDGERDGDPAPDSGEGAGTAGAAD